MPVWLRNLFIAVILLAVTTVVIYSILKEKGLFEKHTHVWVSEELLEEYPDIYLGYNFAWEGVGKPTLTSIELIRENGQVFQSDNTLELDLFVTDQDNETGAVHAENAEETGLIKQYKAVNGFKVEDGFKLILRAQFHEISKDDITELRINYKSFGIKQTQTIPFEGIFSEDETEE